MVLALYGLIALAASVLITRASAGAGGTIADLQRNAGARSPRRWPWARLLHRVFAIEVLVCPRCAGPRRIVGAVTEPHAVRRILVALGLVANPSSGRPIPAA